MKRMLFGIGLLLSGTTGFAGWGIHADRPAGGEVYRSGVLFSPGLGWTAGLRCDRRGGVCDIHGGVPEKGLECI